MKSTLIFSDNSHSPQAMLFAKKVQQAINQDDEGDVKTFEEIEHIRKEYLADNSYVDVPEYGAGPAWKSLLGIRPKYASTIQRNIAHTCKNSSVLQESARRLHRICHAISPTVAIELGTCLGISAAYISSAMPKGTLHTIEGAPAFSNLAKQHFNSKTGFGNIIYHTGPFAESLPKCLSEIEDSIGFAFIDGHHNGQATLDYWGLIKPKIKSLAVIVFDDIRFNVGMVRAWKEITAANYIVAYAALKSDFNPLRRMGLIIYDPLSN